MKYSLTDNLKIITSASIAYILYRLEKNNINLLDLKSSVNLVYSAKLYNKRLHYPCDIKEVEALGIEDFMRVYQIPELEVLCVDLLRDINNHKGSNIVFIDLPDSMPCLSCLVHDPESGFFARSTYGRRMFKDHPIIMFEFEYCFTHREDNENPKT